MKLKCRVSDPLAGCKWYKNGIQLTDGIDEGNGPERSLHFTAVSHDDDGEYECRCGDESTKATVKVKGMHL